MLKTQSIYKGGAHIQLSGSSVNAAGGDNPGGQLKIGDARNDVILVTWWRWKNCLGGKGAKWDLTDQEISNKLLVDFNAGDK